MLRSLLFCGCISAGSFVAYESRYYKSVRACNIPIDTPLGIVPEGVEDGKYYTDCYEIDIDLPRDFVHVAGKTPLHEALLPRYITGFKRCTLYSVEQVAVKLITGKPAVGGMWQVEATDPSWECWRWDAFGSSGRTFFSVSPTEIEHRVRVRFGSAIWPAGGAAFSALSEFHAIYSKLLLAAAVARAPLYAEV